MYSYYGATTRICLKNLNVLIKIIITSEISSQREDLWMLGGRWRLESHRHWGEPCWCNCAYFGNLSDM